MLGLPSIGKCNFKIRQNRRVLPGSLVDLVLDDNCFERLSYCLCLCCCLCLCPGTEDFLRPLHQGQIDEPSLCNTNDMYDSALAINCY